MFYGNFICDTLGWFLDSQIFVKLHFNHKVVMSWECIQAGHYYYYNAEKYKRWCIYSLIVVTQNSINFLP